jgi:hypothetical protein
MMAGCGAIKSRFVVAPKNAMHLLNNIIGGPPLFLVPIDGSVSINLDKINVDGGWEGKEEPILSGSSRPAIRR